jgi:hypothetical protein
MGSAFKKAAPLTGITFAMLYLLGVALQQRGVPAFGAESAEVQTYFTDHYADVVTGAFLVFISAPFWFVFNGVLFAAIREKEAGAGRLGVTLAASGAAAAAITVAGQGIGAMAAIRAHEGTLTPTLSPVYFDVFTGMVYTCTAVVAAAFVFVLAAASLRYAAVLPKWLGAVALVVAVAFLIPVPAVSWAVVSIGVLIVIYASIALYRDGAGEL